MSVMGKHSVDVVVLGGGFAGSLVALILAKQGRRVALLERGQHPRFAIGESSTPLANFVLRSLCDRYDLSGLRPLSRYGTWKKSYPDVRRGIKRGFSFFSHEPGKTFQPDTEHRNELVVAANASVDTADTHWLRADVDNFFIQEAVRGGVEVHQRFSVHRIDRGPPWFVVGGTEDVRLGFEAKYVIDATGQAGLLAPYVDAQPQPLRTRSRAIFSHFTDVERFADTVGLAPGGYPFPPDDAALHHIMPDGWMWMLRFDHGVTSAGMLLGGAGESSDNAETLWARRLGEYPSIAQQMKDAAPLRHLTLTGPLQRRWSRPAGPDFGMLPNTAYFIDPLLSPGNAHSMIGVERLAHVFEAWPNHEVVARRLGVYAELLRVDIDHLDRIIDGSYRAFPSFRLLTAWLMYYFSAAIFSEAKRRDGSAQPEDGFLLSHDAEFHSKVTRGYEALAQATQSGQPSDGDVSALVDGVMRDIEPYDLTGLGNPDRKNLHPYA